MKTFISLMSKKMNKQISFTPSSFRHLHSSLLHNILILHSNPFYLELIYFFSLSSIGFLALKSTNPRTPNTKPNDINLFFTSVSASTVSSMSTVEMEIFTNTQLVFLTILMFLGGEVFTSMLRLHLKGANKERTLLVSSDSYENFNTHIELGTFRVHEKAPDVKLKKSIKILAYLVTCYILVTHIIGSALVAGYLRAVPGAKKVLETKGIKMLTFSVFTTVSTFSNCGFVPTNENMVVFRSNPGLMLILIPQILMGNTLYPVFLRLSIWVMTKMTRRLEFSYVLENNREVGYGHLLPRLDTLCLGMTALGFIVVQMVLFCALEWSAESVGGGLSVYEKAVAILFQVVNSRHAGESVFDLSAVSPAILVMFVVMMYLPPYTSYLPIKQAENGATNTEQKKKTNKGFWENILFSQLSYIFIFVFLICITERHKMKTDPLNFNLLSIVVEVVSAYGNVGLSVGYSCERRINLDGDCKDAWYGFVGKWSDEGKCLLIIVMFFGKLKKFNKRGGKAWRLA
ncbi:hypothetical protein CASFOL_013650 [Castilleja foliolosa]|uniref:Uncharacterized protein n=1 Tax=Castilleja foliolosa TaxID=1961234 RepID=A0ABD3DPM7_9LAMI